MRWGDKAIEALLEELQLFLKEEVLEAVLKLCLLIVVGILYQ
jgi:hypothetical protein